MLDELSVVCYSVTWLMYICLYQLKLEHFFEFWFLERVVCFKVVLIVMIHRGKRSSEGERERERERGKVSMECNRDEAARAKEIAEVKFLAKDVKGAKKFALKAQNLYPELDGIFQMVMTLEVYLSAEEKKIHGESNWYGILGVSPLADDETIRKQYRKLALILHPDKNRSIGAEGAFQLVSQAWSLLSDKSNRIAYDRRRGEALQQRNQIVNGDPAPPPKQNGFYNFAKNAASKSRVPKGNSSKRNGVPKGNSSNRDGVPKGNSSNMDGVPKGTSINRDGVPRGNSSNKDGISKDYSGGRDVLSSHPRSVKERHTFWTVCHRCKMQYEYLRMYLNHHLLCPNCHEAYLATEIDPPSSNCSKTPFQTSNSNHWQSTSHRGSNAMRNNSATPHAGFNRNNESNHSNFQWTPFSESTGAESAVQAANMVQQAYEKVKRERQKAQAATRREEALRRKNLSSKRTMGSESSGHYDAVKRRKISEDCDTSKETMKHVRSESGTIHAPKFSVLKQHSLQKQTSNHDSVSRVDIKQFLMEKGREEICKKLNELISNSMAQNPVHEEIREKTKENDSENIKDSSFTDPGKCNQDKFPEPVEDKIQIPLNKLQSGTFWPLDREPVGQMSVSVPDPDFFDFDKDRTVKCFGDNQIWAVYDDDDGMPRHYTMIHDVISLNPFNVRLSWLNSITNSGLAHVNWFRNGFSKTCGEFRTGRVEICNSVDSFSHRVQWIKCSPETIQIFPRKGDVWALYRNWSSEWNELTEGEVMHKYEMVEVLEDYDKELGVIVIPLVKIAGFKAVFHQHFNPIEIKTIPLEEMSRFSHQVPSHLLTDQEESKSLRGCRELDPAATPFEILHVISKIEGIESMEVDEDVEFVEEVDCDGSARNRTVDGLVIETEMPLKNKG